MPITKTLPTIKGMKPTGTGGYLMAPGSQGLLTNLEQNRLASGQRFAEGLIKMDPRGPTANRLRGMGMGGGLFGSGAGMGGGPFGSGAGSAGRLIGDRLGSAFSRISGGSPGAVGRGGGSPSGGGDSHNALLQILGPDYETKLQQLRSLMDEGLF